MTSAIYAFNNQKSHSALNSPARPQTIKEGGGDVSPRWRAARRSSTSSIDGTTAETNSTATTITEPSNYDGPQGPHMTRTNFGDYQYYIPPETKSSPYSVPTGAPVTPTRDPWSSPSRVDRRLPQKLKLPMLSPRSPPEREPRQEPASHPSPLDQKRLAFFDDAASDQVPFDQVWNQQEFTLDQNIGEDGSDNQEEECDDQSVKSEGSKPFDEEPPDLGVSGSSAFSAFSAGSSTAALPPAPPPPPSTPRQPKKHSPPRHSRKGPTSPIVSRTSTPTHSNGSPSRRSLSSPEARDNVCTSNDDGEIPSDEDERRGNRDNGFESQHRSLAVASKRKTAEDVNSRIEVLGKSSNKDDDDDGKSVDSLFDFELGKRGSLSPRPTRMTSLPDPQTSPPDSPSSPPASPSSPKSPRSLGKWRKLAPAEIASSDDDENSRDGDGVKGLKTRAQQAFATRKRLSPKKCSPPRPSSPRKPPSPLPQKSIAAVPSAARGETASDPPPQRKNQVSFTATNTIHTFQHEYDMYSQSDVSNGTYEEKTIGADVEEAIRDIFMINTLGACGPSPRRIRYHSDTRFERRDSEQSYNDSEEDEEDDTVTGAKSDEDSVNEKPETSRRRSSEPKQDPDIEEKLDKAESPSEDIFFETMLTMVEGGLGAMSAAFGFGTEGSNDKTAHAKERNVVTPPSSSSPPRSPRNGKSPSNSPSRKERSNGSPIEGVFDSVSDYILGADKSDSEDDQDSMLAPRDEREFNSKRAPMAPSTEDEDEPQSLEEDPRLLELAKQSALCMHEILGVQYDESRGVDIGDVKFVVVVLSRPLGIVFQEDYSGCWITKIMPTGNADKSGKVEAGDQLAAINGSSSIGMKVDDICEAISVASSKSTEIELTFLRYVGPFQPIQDDGIPRPGTIADAFEANGSERGMYEMDKILVEDEKPRSTLSITGSLDSRSMKKKGSAPKSPKRVSIRKKFKWLTRGKKQATKAE